MLPQEEVDELTRLAEMAKQSRQRALALSRARQDRMYRVMVENGLTQAQMAQALGVSPATVQQAVKSARSRPLTHLGFGTLLTQGRWARELRLRAGKDRREVARQAGVTQTWLKQVEEGRPTDHPGWLPKLFEVLGVEVDAFLVRDRGQAA